MAPSPDYERNIFLNCPFDDEYQPLFRAVMFAVLTCGFRARCALEADDGGRGVSHPLLRRLCPAAGAG
jgi:hypothetical protein